ncbi:hypothetical protein SDC9_141338 [bioreactor metagenome]|uniref:Uncharacterized protein n=1 Tax=bioreactor metagenome TaxID=1076179 RepID=A0A645E007_9ZZZZ
MQRDGGRPLCRAQCRAAAPEAGAYPNFWQAHGGNRRADAGALRLGQGHAAAAHAGAPGRAGGDFKGAGGAVAGGGGEVRHEQFLFCAPPAARLSGTQGRRALQAGTLQPERGAGGGGCPQL